MTNVEPNRVSKRRRMIRLLTDVILDPVSSVTTVRSDKEAVDVAAILTALCAVDAAEDRWAGR